LGYKAGNNYSTKTFADNNNTVAKHVPKLRQIPGLLPYEDCVRKTYIFEEKTNGAKLSFEKNSGN
jgi:hypothetical protein